MNILVIAPHPDDDVLGCGGSIVNHRKNGDVVSVVYITSGESGDATVSKTDLAQTREQEAIQGQKILDVTDTTFLHQPDGGVIINPEILRKMTELIRAKKPNLVYLPHQKDAHKDHRTTYEIGMEAIYRAGAHAFQEYSGVPFTVDTILAYEVWTPLTAFSYVENISDSIEQKIKALSQHKSQLANVPYDEAIKGLNRYRGALTGKGIFCECFDVIKLTNLR